METNINPYREQHSTTYLYLVKSVFNNFCQYQICLLRVVMCFLCRFVLRISRTRFKICSKNIPRCVGRVSMMSSLFCLFSKSQHLCSTGPQRFRSSMPQGLIIRKINWVTNKFSQFSIYYAFSNKKNIFLWAAQHLVQELVNNVVFNIILSKLCSFTIKLLIQFVTYFESYFHNHRLFHARIVLRSKSDIK